MKNILRVLIITAICIFNFTLSAFPEEDTPKWTRVIGKWEIGKDGIGNYLLESKIRTYNRGYSELINYNSLASYKPLPEYSSIKLSFAVMNPAKCPVEVMLFFAGTEYRDFFAFKFIINEKDEDKVQFICSKVKDKSLKRSVKNNYMVTALESKLYTIEFGREYSIEIRVNKAKAALFINGKKEIEAEADRDLGTGLIGFSSRNAQFRIRGVKVYSGDKIVFEDDFSKDSIKRWTVRAKKVNTGD